MAEKLEQFLITITVIEGRHFVWPNMDTAVHIMVDGQKQCTNISYNTDSPFFNEVAILKSIYVCKTKFIFLNF